MTFVSRQFIFFCFMTLVFLGVYSPSAYASKCDNTLIKAEAVKVRERLQETPEGEKLLISIDKQVEYGDFKPEDKQDVILANIEFSIRYNRGCKIPDNLTARLIASSSEGTSDEENCPIEQFHDEAKSHLAQMNAKDPDGNFYDSTFQEASNEITNSAAQEKFNKKWKNKSFRDRYMIAILNSGLREENKCSNPALPLAEVIQEILVQ